MLDESQNLSREQLEEVRFFGNRYGSARRMLQIFLVGQPWLENRLAERGLESINQRAAVRASVQPLTREQTESYMLFRLRVSDAKSTHLFTSEAIDIVFDRTKGVARLINILCERALAVGFADGVPVIDGSTVVAAIADLPARLLDSQAEDVSPCTASPAIGRDAHQAGDDTLHQQLDRVERKLDHVLDVLSRAGVISRARDDLPGPPSGASSPSRGAPEHFGPPLSHEHDPCLSKA